MSNGGTIWTPNTTPMPDIGSIECQVPAQPPPVIYSALWPHSHRETHSHQAVPFLRPVGESCVWIACAVPHCKPGLMNISDNDLDPASVRAGSKVLRIVSAFKIWFSTVLPARSSVLTYDLQNLGFSTHHRSAKCDEVAWDSPSWTSIVLLLRDECELRRKLHELREIIS